MKLSDILRGRIPSLAPASPQEPCSLMAAIQRVEEVFPDLEPTVRETNPDTVLTALARRIESRNWQDCTAQDMADALRHAFTGPMRAQAAFDPVRDFLGRELAATPLTSLLKAAVDAHVANYVQQGDHTQALAKTLKARREDLPTRSREFLAALPEALDAKGGAAALGKRMAWEQDPQSVFATLPFVPSGGLIDEASMAFVEALAPRMNDLATARRVLDWFAPKGKDARKVGAPVAVAALLAPWHCNEPTAGWKQELLDRLVGAYGDPRMPKGRQSAVWDEIDATARETFVRWQTGETLEAFLNIISIVIEEEKVEGRHMWPARRKFWQGMYEEGHIEAAWVAFNKKAAAKANELSQSSGDRSLSNFGRQIARGGRADTSILVLRVNGYTVVEGSHSYKVHVFPRDHRKQPKLFEYRYDCEEIRLSLPDERHKRVHDTSGNWMHWVRRETGCQP